MSDSSEHFPSGPDLTAAPMTGDEDDSDHHDSDHHEFDNEAESISTRQQLLSTIQHDPLLDPTMTGNEEQTKKSHLHLFLLTLCMFGLQVAWSIEFSQGTPYLQELGISKSIVALVWIAGPLGGILVQPYVGIRSDRCRSRFGRRRPFIVGGAVATVITYLALAWSKQIVSGLFGLFDVSSATVSTITIVFAVIMFYVVDFSINIMQAGIRAFIVDDVPSHQQDSANAWASRISGIGGIVAYALGSTVPTKSSPLNVSQFQILILLLSLAVICTVAISCFSVTERDSRFDDLPKQSGRGVLAYLKTLWLSARSLPVQVKRVCYVQFFAWIGWFPILFYTTTYIAQIYCEPYFSMPDQDPDNDNEELEKLLVEGTRHGTFAMFVFAIVSFAASIFLPLAVTNSNEPRKQRFSIQVPGLTLRNAWFLSHILFALLMSLTFVVHSTTSATVLIVFVGIPWAMAQWAPFALIATEIRKREATRRKSLDSSLPPGGYGLRHENSNEQPEESTDQAGVVLGLHNVAIAAPQFLSSLTLSLIFYFLQKKPGRPGDHSVTWALRFAGLCALVAAVLTLRVKDDGVR